MKSLRYIFPFLYSSIMFFSIACKENIVSSNENKLSEGFLGQLETDIDYAIIKPNGTIWTWGSNSTGQLGDGTMMPSETPKQILTLNKIVAIDLVEGAAYAADIEGNIWFWGDRLIWAEPPDEDTIVTVPKKISLLKGVIFLQVFSSEITLLINDGTVWKLTWDHRTPTKYLIPEQVQGLNNIVAISGYLALKSDGTLIEFPEYGWREAIDGCLNNNGDFILKNIKEIKSMWFSFSIALLKDNTVWGWGRNHGGFLGDGTFQDDPNPKIIKDLQNIIHISVNGGRCLALKSDGTVWFWGLIGIDSNPQYQNVPTRIENIDNIKLIHASAANKCIVMKNDGTYWSIDIKNNEVKKIELP